MVDYSRLKRAERIPFIEGRIAKLGKCRAGMTIHDWHELVDRIDAQLEAEAKNDFRLPTED